MARYSYLREWSSAFAMIVLGALLVAGFSGCVTEPDPLDKTQPESVNKAMFQGEWYFKVTVTDTEWHNPINFIGEETQTFSGTAYKIRWEVSQDYLNGYLIPQSYLDADGNRVENKIGRESLALSFRIEKQFDIKYMENSTTREDLNVIVENTDRPWNQREYMIVDWSKNLVTDFWQPLGAEAVSGEIVREPVATWKNVEFFDTNDERVDTRAWDPQDSPDVYVMNIDIQEQIFVPLQMSWFKYSESSADPALVKYRISLLKKKPRGASESTYEPMAYPDEFFRRFGYFRTEYATYDVNRGPLESQKQYLINRFDVGCSSDGNCKTVDWYKSPSMPTKEQDPDLHAWTVDVIGAWNKVFQQATGRTDDVVVLHENEPLLDGAGNPVLDMDGNPRFKYETGDLRYNFINYVSRPNQGAPLGYGPSTPDADTGEIINATVNVYGNWLDYVITRALDLYDVMAGNCTLNDIAAGRYFDDATGICDGGDSDNPTVQGQATSISMGLEQPNQPADMNFLTPAMRTAYWPKSSMESAVAKLNPQDLIAAEPLAQQIFTEHRKQVRPLDLGKFSIVGGTKYESMMVPSASFGSTFPSAQGPDQVAGMFSPATRLSEGNLLAARDFLDAQSLSTRTEPEHFESNILGFVEQMKGKPRHEVKRELRKWIYYTTTLHEMGHTFGLRHNFRASVDQQNFPPQYFEAYDKYWKEITNLRSKYSGAIRNGDADAYKEYTEAVHRIASNHDRYATTSIMDYMGDFEAWVEMPSYDVAAIAFGYAQKIEVEKEGEWTFDSYEDGDFNKDNLFDYGSESDSGRVVRYYQFCSDERVWDDAFCSRFDRGVTATEITQNFIRDQYKGYFFKNFKRDREGFGRNSGYWRKWMNYYSYAKPLSQMTVNTFWHDEFWSSIWNSLGNIAYGPEDKSMEPGYMPTGGEDLLRASMLFYYYLMNDVLQRPDYGTYKLAYDDYGKQFWEKTEAMYVQDGDVTANIAMGAGWGWSDKWDSQYDNGIYYDKLIRQGVEVDKIIAYEILSIPAALNTYLWHEKANGLSYWNSLWNGNGSQLWKVTRAFITDGFDHNQNPYCMGQDGELSTQPVDILESMMESGIVNLAGYEIPERRCPTGTFPVQPGMDALYPIYPMFFGLAGSQHPWYHNQLSDYMDSQVKGGNHRFDLPQDADIAEFLNSTGTKTYQAVQTEDGLSISYEMLDRAQRLSNRIRYVKGCQDGTIIDPVEEEVPEGEQPHEPAPLEVSALIGTHGRTCSEVVQQCMGDSQADFCASEGWDPIYSLDVDSMVWREVDRSEAMLIMMQDMIDLAGHYAWRTPGYMQGN